MYTAEIYERDGFFAENQAAEKLCHTFSLPLRIRHERQYLLLATFLLLSLYQHIPGIHSMPKGI